MNSIPIKACDKEYSGESSGEVNWLLQCASSKTTKESSPPPAGDIRQIEVNTKNPFVQKPDGRLHIDLCMNLSFFKLEEIEITIKNNTMAVTATRVENEQGSQVKNQLVRELQLPSGCDVSRVAALLTKDGMLLVKGPIR